MAKLSKKHEFILYALLKYLQKLNKGFEDKPLEVSVSKIDFIKLIQDLEIVEKTQRGLYKNLQVLEKKKYLTYDNKLLKITEKGLKLGKEKEKEFVPYLRLILKLESGKKKHSGQTYFR